MNWAWATSLDHIWRSPAFPMWLTLAAAGFFGIIVLITLLRATKSVANGVLAVIALLATGIAVASTVRGFDPEGGGTPGQTRTVPPMTAALPALSCIDDLAGEAVLTACEKALFGSPESAAAAIAYAASQITRLTAFGDVAAANQVMAPEMQAVRRAVERDRYGLMAYVLAARDHCSPSDCAAFRALTDQHQIIVNMNERVYEGLISHYEPLWNAPPIAPVAALPPSMPTGRPTNAEFPTAASTPPVSIMTPEPGTAVAPTRAPATVANAPSPSSRPTPPPPATVPAVAAAKKQPAPKSVRTAAPVQLAPAASAPATPAPAAASND
jgi:hypothetical protein